MTRLEITDACGDDPGWVCREVFELTDSSTVASITGGVASFLGRTLVVLALALAVWLLIKRTISHARDTIIERKRSEDVLAVEQQRTVQRADTVARVLRSITLALLVAIVVLIILGELGVNLAPLIAGAGIAGLAVGFGAQSLVADFVSGIFMLMDDEYAVGDVVNLGDGDGGASGVVEEFGLRTTKLRALDGTLWTIRNGQITHTGNMTHHFGQAVLDINVAYGTDVRHASQVIARTADELRRDPDFAPSFLREPELMGVESLAADAVTIRLRCTTPPGSQWTLARELRTRIKEALDREGIEIPFAQRAVWIRTDSQAVVPGPAVQPDAE